MSFIRKNKFIIIAIGIFLILVFLAFQVKMIFFPEEGKAIYGNRLDGIEEVEITKARKESIESAVKEDSATKSVSVNVSGKIIEVIITVQDDTPVDTAKNLSTKISDTLKSDEKKFYDVQIFIKKENDAKDFPIIGYKHHAKDEFSWTKDRGTE